MMTDKTIRWGMIGCGNVTEKKSAPSFNKIENSRLVAVVSRTPEKAERYAERHGIPTWHRNPADVIHNPRVDIVYVATPPGSHKEYALETIAAGKPVYIEKPMARTGDECRIINQEAENKGVPVFVAYYRRSLDYFLKVKEIIENGLLGRILTIQLQQHFPARPEDYHRKDPPWRVIPEISGGGYFHDVGCHALDILFYIFGDPLKASGLKTNLAGLYEPEDTVGATLILRDGIVVTGSWSFIVPERFHKDRVEVTGEKGRLLFSVFSFDPITLTRDHQSESFHTTRPEHIQMPFIRTIVSDLKGTGKCPSTGLTAEITSRVMDQILR